VLLLGLVTFVSVSYASTNPGGGNRQMREISRTEWSVNGSWTGGYPNESSWLSETMEAVRSAPPTLVTAILALLLGALGIAVKLHVAEVLEEEETVRWREDGGRRRGHEV
jgi:hypothetical protein